MEEKLARKIGSLKCAVKNNMAGDIMGATKEKLAYDMPFPTRLRNLLDEKGINQQEIADFVGVKRQTIAQWKDGKTVPDIYNFQKMAQFFGVPYEYLLGDTDSRVRENLHLEETLGLSDGAIEALKGFQMGATENRKEKNTRIPLSWIVSEILRHEKFATSIRYFQDCLWESNLKTIREYDYKYNEKISREINEAMSFLQSVGIAVMDVESMKSYHLELAKTCYGRALESIEGKMLADRLRKIISFTEQNAGSEDADDKLHEFLVKEFGYGDSGETRQQL